MRWREWLTPELVDDDQQLFGYKHPQKGPTVNSILFTEDTLGYPFVKTMRRTIRYTEHVFVPVEDESSYPSHTSRLRRSPAVRSAFTASSWVAPSKLCPFTSRIRCPSRNRPSRAIAPTRWIYNKCMWCCQNGVNKELLLVDYILVNSHWAEPGQGQCVEAFTLHLNRDLLSPTLYCTSFKTFHFRLLWKP